MLVYRYRLHDTTGDDLGTVEHPAPNVEPGDVIVLRDGRTTAVLRRVEGGDGAAIQGLITSRVVPGSDA